MSNFLFLQAEWPAVFDAASSAESSIDADPRAACFYARRALELAVAWAYKSDVALHLPYRDNLSALLHESVRRRHPGKRVRAREKSTGFSPVPFACWVGRKCAPPIGFVAPLRERSCRVVFAQALIVVFPPQRRSHDLARVATAAFPLGRKVIADSQFPDSYTTPAGIVLQRPARWAAAPEPKAEM